MVLVKVVNDFIQYEAIPNQYNGLMYLPFDYYVTKKKSMRIKKSCVVIASSTIQNINKNDEIISIAGHDIDVSDNVYILDTNYKESIPLDIFIRLYFNSMTPINLVFNHHKKIINVDIYGVPEHKSLVLSNRSYYNPSHYMPHIDINGVIIVQLTHELLDLTIINKIYIKNSVIDKYFENIDDVNPNIILIIDCLSDVTAKKYDLPQIFLEKQTILCPIVTMINNKIISTLVELENEIGQCQKSLIKLKVLFSDSDQREIEL